MTVCKQKEHSDTWVCWACGAKRHSMHVWMSCCSSVLKVEASGYTVPTLSLTVPLHLKRVTEKYPYLSLGLFLSVMEVSSIYMGVWRAQQLTQGKWQDHADCGDGKE